MLRLLLILTCPHVTLPRPVRVSRIKGANLFEPKASLFVPPTDACWTWGPAQRATASASPFFAFFLWRSKERRWLPGHSRQLSIIEEITTSNLMRPALMQFPHNNMKKLSFERIRIFVIFISIEEIAHMHLAHCNSMAKRANA